MRGQLHRGDRLPNVVMQVARDGAPLIFLQRKQTFGHRLQLDIALGQGIAHALGFAQIAHHQQLAAASAIADVAGRQTCVEGAAVATTHRACAGDRLIAIAACAQVVAHHRQVVVAHQGLQRFAQDGFALEAELGRAGRVGVHHMLVDENQHPVGQHAHQFAKLLLAFAQQPARLLAFAHILQGAVHMAHAAGAGHAFGAQMHRARLRIATGQRQQHIDLHLATGTHVFDHAFDARLGRAVGGGQQFFQPMLATMHRYAAPQQAVDRWRIAAQAGRAIQLPGAQPRDALRLLQPFECLVAQILRLALFAAVNGDDQAGRAAGQMQLVAPHLDMPRAAARHQVFVQHAGGISLAADLRNDLFQPLAIGIGPDRLQRLLQELVAFPAEEFQRRRIGVEDAHGGQVVDEGRAGQCHELGLQQRLGLRQLGVLVHDQAREAAQHQVDDDAGQHQKARIRPALRHGGAGQVEQPVAQQQPDHANQQIQAGQGPQALVQALGETKTGDGG